MDECVIIERIPTVEEYMKLRKSAGWGDIDAKGVETGFGSSLYSVCALCRDEIVGCGRVIGDGSMYFYIQDMIVLREFQKKGIGGRIMDAVPKYIFLRACPGAFIGLMAASGVSGFYEKYGFL